MTQFRIEVVVDPRKAVSGNRKTRKELEKTETQAAKLGGALKRAFAFLGVGLVVRELAVLADEFTNVQNRLRVVTDGTDDLTFATEQLFAIADRTRSAYEGTADLYARVALATRELGIEQQQLLDFTESVNQAIILSGASAREANAGLIQLSQGLASGALRGDELRSVLEQLPVVADVIAKSMGVTRGELRELGSEGKITAGIVLEAFKEARQELDDNFAQTVPTLAQSFTVLRNNVVEYVGAADQATGASEGVSASIIFLASNLDLLTQGLLILAIAAIPAAITSGIALTTTIKAITIASATMSRVLATAALFNPIVLGAAVAGVATIALIDLMFDAGEAAREVTAEGKKFLLTDESTLLTAVQNIEQTMQRIRDAADEGRITPEAAEENIAVLTARIAELREEQDALASGTVGSLMQLREQAAVVARLDGAVSSFTAALVKEADANVLTSRELENRAQLLKAIADIEKEGGSKVTDLQREQIQSSIEQAQALRDQAAAFERIKGPQQQFEADLAALSALQRAGKIEIDEMNAAIADLASTAGGIDLSQIALPEGIDLEGQLGHIRELIEAARTRAEAESVTSQTVIEGLRQEQAVLQLLAEGRNEEAAKLQIIHDLRSQGISLNDAELNHIAALNKQNDALTLQAQILQDIKGPEQERIASQEILSDLLEQDIINLGEYEAALAKLAPAAEDIATPIADAFGTADEALFVLIKDGKAGFSDLTQSIADDLLKLALKQGISAIFGSLGGDAGGSGFLSSFFGGARAEGGDVNPNQAFLVGEEGPELFQPERAGSIVPAGETAARLTQQAAAPVVNVAPPAVTINNISDPDEIKSAMESADGEQSIENVFRRSAKKFKAILS